MAWTKAHRLPSRSIEMQSIGTKAFWIGEPDAEKVVLYFHGGGYAMPASDGHFTFASSLVSKAAGSGKSVAVLILQYDLAPGGRYPRQLLQAVELLRHCMDSLGRSPEQLILLGDSAGGNMIFGLLSHLLHSHPGIEPLKLSKPLKTAVLSSPVTSLNTKGQRYRTHEGQDPASAKTIQIWFGNLLEAASPDEWNEPLSNDTDWWLGLERAVEDMMMTVASNEMMADDTRACAANLKVRAMSSQVVHDANLQSVYENLTLFASEVDFHAEMSIGPSLGLKEGEAAKVIVSYIIERA